MAQPPPARKPGRPRDGGQNAGSDQQRARSRRSGPTTVWSVVNENRSTLGHPTALVERAEHRHVPAGVELQADHVGALARVEPRAARLEPLQPPQLVEELRELGAVEEERLVGGEPARSGAHHRPEAAGREPRDPLETQARVGDVALQLDVERGREGERERGHGTSDGRARGTILTRRSRHPVGGSHSVGFVRG